MFQNATTFPFTLGNKFIAGVAASARVVESAVANSSAAEGRPSDEAAAAPPGLAPAALPETALLEPGAPVPAAWP